jgi:predicted alpha/beta hydrolase family esterase
MRTADADILIIPGWSGSGETHWQTRWERNLKTARRVEQGDWIAPDRAAWAGAITQAIAASTRPVILIAHSLGVIATVHALQSLHTLHASQASTPSNVAGAFFVAPADVTEADTWPTPGGHRLDARASGFTPLPEGPLRCPSALVASANDPYCRLERAREFALNWGSTLLEAGEVGHINTDSGHGPWPEGLMQLGWFLKGL